ncbi:hypothetical protein FHX15_005993 [Rhizobium sp. BK650]|uniref:hypothetical protein n=1 Tax=Rhizobium sp. BK650 TaxID=2586990 RepID=UPI0017F0B4F1|nr:hypothetical protein [Rhizobium sp. BK650]MBB3660722.1 hypothetical protein [Rhizobium sp. BK650]
MNAVNRMMVFSAVALASWMVAGAIAIFDIHRNLRHPTASHVAEVPMGGFMLVGTSVTVIILASALA